MADHHIGGASQAGQGPKNNILQQILDKIQEQSLEITALKLDQNTPTDQILDKIQEQSIKIAALEQAQKTPELMRNPSPNPAIHIRPESPTDPLNPPPENKNPSRTRRNSRETAGILSGGISKYLIRSRLTAIP